MTLRLLVSVVGALALLAVPSVGRAETVCFDAGSAEHIEMPMRKTDASDPEPVKSGAAIAGAAGNVYLEIPAIKEPSEQDKKAHARFRFAARNGGEYFLWLRVWWNDECSNSFRVGINDQPPFIMGRNRTFRQWHWVKSPPRVKQLHLDKGEHILTIRYREDNVKLDQILLTTDRRFVPVDIEPTTAP